MVSPRNAVRFDRTVGRSFYRLHRWVYEKSGGRLWAKGPEGPMLLLATTGRKTGQRRTTTLLYFTDGDGFIVVGSNGGRPETPSWVHNLRADPHATVLAGRRRVDVRAEILTGEAASPWWPRLNDFYKGWAHYKTITDRELPVIRLVPVDADAQSAAPNNP